MIILTKFVAIVGIAALALFACCLTREAVVFRSSSPDGRYNVEVTESSGIGALLFSTNFSLHLRKEGKDWAKPSYLIGFDDRQGFTDRYSKIEWVEDRTLRMFDKRNEQELGDFVKISNQSNQSLKYLRVRTVGLHLLLDVASTTETKIYVPYFNPAANIWIEANGEFEDGSPIPTKGVNFNKSPLTNREQPAYCVFVTDAGVIIQSATSEGLSSDRSPIPPNPGCVYSSR